MTLLESTQPANPRHRNLQYLRGVHEQFKTMGIPAEELDARIVACLRVGVERGYQYLEYDAYLPFVRRLHGGADLLEMHRQLLVRKIESGDDVPVTIRQIELIDPSWPKSQDAAAAADRLLAKCLATPLERPVCTALRMKEASVAGWLKSPEARAIGEQLLATFIAAPIGRRDDVGQAAALCLPDIASRSELCIDVSVNSSLAHSPQSNATRAFPRWETVSTVKTWAQDYFGERIGITWDPDQEANLEVVFTIFGEPWYEKSFEGSLENIAMKYGKDAVWCALGRRFRE